MGTFIRPARRGRLASVQLTEELTNRVARIHERVGRSHAGDHYGLQNVLQARNGRPVQIGQIWQVVDDICVVLGPVDEGWSVQSLYSERQYGAKDGDFLYYISEEEEEEEEESPNPFWTNRRSPRRGSRLR